MPVNHPIGKFVIVRTYSAGVHAGTLVSQDGKVVELINAQRIWYWTGANTLHEVAIKGVGSGSKVSKSVSQIVLTEAIEVIVATLAAQSNIEATLWGE